MIVLILAVFASDPVIAGVVKDGAGKPVAGAMVALSHMLGEDDETTTTDAEGRFRLANKRSKHPEIRGGMLGAFRPDQGLVLHHAKEGPADGIELRLVKASGVRVVVLDSNGKPIKDARTTVRVYRFGEYWNMVPRPIAEKMAVQTASNGAAVFPALEPKHVMQLSVETPPGLKFTFYRTKDDAGWDTLQLPPTTTVKGRLAGATWPKGEEVWISSYAAVKDARYSSVRLELKVRPNDEGAFTAAAIADGRWYMYPRNEAFWVTNYKDQAKATSGAPEKVWTLGSTVAVSGVVRTDDGKPVAGARVSLTTRNPLSDSSFGAGAITDAHGRYSARVWPGRLSRDVTTPEGHFNARSHISEGIELSGTKPVELPPIVVQANTTISGVVKDETGKAAVGVRVLANCVVPSGGGGSSGTLKFGTTKENGAFEITAVPKGALVALYAFDEKRGMYSNEVAAEPSTKEVAIKLDPSLATPLSVLATDEAGKPISKVEYRIEAQDRRIYDSGWLSSLRPELQKGMKSTSPTPFSIGAVPKALKYQVVASADGFHSGRSPIVPGDKLDGPITLKLRRALEAVGRVVDSDGKPIAGALVKPAGCYQSEASATTDSEGRFKLTGLANSTMVLTAHRNGFRYGGGVAKGGKPTTITLKRPNEAAPRSMATAFPPRHAETARKLMAPLADIVFRDKAVRKTFWGESYAFIDPPRLLEMIGGPEWKIEDRDACRRHLAAALAATDADEAIAQAQAIVAVDGKAEAMLDVAKRLPEPAKEKRRQVLADALTAARACSDPARRAVLVAKVGEALFLAGDADGAKIIREAEEIAKKIARLGPPATAVGTVGESLALVDFAAAMDLTKDLPGYDGAPGKSRGRESIVFNRHRGNIAVKVAGRQPENAEKAFASMNVSHFRGPYAARICYRMAVVDLPRAKRIAVHAERGNDKAMCLAGIAAALGPSKASDALPFLRDAYATMEKERDPLRNSSHLALALTSIAAAVAPNEVDEFFWRALTIRGGFDSGMRSAHSMSERLGIIGLTALLAERFAPEVSEGLTAALKPEIEALLTRIRENQIGSDSEIPALAALLAYDPESCQELFKRWAPPIGNSPQIRADYARLHVALLLHSTPTHRAERILERHLLQRSFDKED
jgi:hypothetical protein